MTYTSLFNEIRDLETTERIEAIIKELMTVREGAISTGQNPIHMMLYHWSLYLSKEIFTANECEAIIAYIESEKLNVLQVS